MTHGGLIKILDKRFKGDFYHTSRILNTVFNGFTVGRETIPIHLPKLVENDVSTVLLEIGVVSQSSRIDWKLRVNGFNVTKEFKPLVSTKIGGLVFTKHVYDVTSIVTSSESRGRRYINVTVRREGGEPFILKHIDLGVVYVSEDADSKITYYSGGLMIEPGGRFSFKTIGLENHTLCSTFVVPSGSASILVKAGGWVEKIDGLTDVKNYSTTMTSDEVEFEHVVQEGSPQKPVIVSNLLMYKVALSKPKLVVESVRYENGFLLVKVKNIGEAKPDQAIVSVISHGSTIHVGNIPLLSFNDEHEVSIPVKLPPGERELCVRVIWRKISKTDISDYKLKVSLA